MRTALYALIGLPPTSPGASASAAQPAARLPKRLTFFVATGGAGLFCSFAAN